MRIDQEMSKGKDYKHNNPPNVIAKLMGLDTLPKGKPDLSAVRSHREDYPQHRFGHLESPLKHWQLEDRFMDKAVLHEVHHHPRDKLPQRRWREDAVDEEKMGLIRHKFMEAKHMSTDERLRQSKQFGDALEVLSSNSDLLVRFLDLQNLYELPSTPRDERERITLIKPLKMVDNDKSFGKGKKSDRLIKKPKNTGKSPECREVDEFPVQSTRIVVLKPSPGRTHDLKSLISPTTASPQSFYQGPENDIVESIKVAKEIRRQIHEGRKGYQKDKTSHSSVFSNGYSSDESSFNKSYHEYAAGKFGHLETMTLSSLPRHSWDCIDGCGSPYSTKSLGRASCSPESLVCIEAKKRLSERWNMITSNDKGQQKQRCVQRSSTLGEMLSLSLVKKSVTPEVESTNKEQQPSKDVSCNHSFNKEIGIVDCPKNVPGSNYVPEPSTVYETQLSSEVYDHGAHGSEVLVKSKSKRSSSSFKGKVASFLFSRNKKSTKKKSSPSQSKDESQSSVPPLNDESQSFNSSGFEECSLASLCESLDKTSTDSVSNGQQQDMITIEPGSTGSKYVVPEISFSSQKQDQPSPISVLEPPFENYYTTHESLDCIKGGHMGSEEHLKSNLIDKSPPIESVARTLSWDDSCAETANHSLDTNAEEHEWLILVQKLLSAAGLDDEQQFDPFHSRWYSLESPLDPSLRATYANLRDKDILPHNEAKRRKIRSNQKLVFDCVNEALLEVVGYGSKNYFKGMYSGSHKSALVQEGPSPYLVDHIVAQMKDLIASGMRKDCEDNHSLVVENVVRKEVVEIGWVELMRLEIDILGREIEGMLIEELVENAVVDFTGRA